MTGAAFRLATVLLPVLYFALAAPGPDSGRRRLRAVLGVLVAFLHAGFLLLVRHETGVSPLVVPGAVVSALALSLFLVYSWVEWRSGVVSLHAPVLLTACVLQCAATGIGFSPGGLPPKASSIFVAHVITIIASVATLLLSGFFGVIYLVAENEMRARRFGFLFARLPKLSELASMMRLAANAGFVLMTVGYNVGIWQAHASAQSGFSYLDPVVLVTMATWAVFGLIALSRWVRFLSGRKAAVTAVFGLVLLAFTIVVSVVPGLSFHRLF